MPTRAPAADAAVLHRIVKAYDVRGLVAGELTPDVAEALGAGVARVLPHDGGVPVVVGRDMRPSGPELVAAFVAGVTGQGVDVVDIGLASTDQLYFASGMLDAPGAMFTASHNPAGYNGVKLCRRGAQPVAIDSGLGEVRELATQGLEHAATPGVVSQRDVLADFAAHVRGFVDVDALGPLRLGVDAGNGMAGHVLPAVFDGLPFQVEALYFELDGTFPNHPANPLEEANLRDLQELVRREGLPLGLAFDGDADRMFAIDEHGEPVASSLVGAVVADRLLARTPGATILHNLICSDTVRETIERAGGTAVRTRVGHSFIKRRMAETDALFAAEHSGHYYFRDNFRADSGLIAALVLLEAVSAAGAPLSQVVAPYDRYVASGEINFSVDDVDAVTARVAASVEGDTDTEDGLTVRLEHGWFNLRPSNTEPLLRLNAEGRDRASMEAIRDQVAGIVLGAVD